MSEFERDEITLPSVQFNAVDFPSDAEESERPRGTAKINHLLLEAADAAMRVAGIEASYHDAAGRSTLRRAYHAFMQRVLQFPFVDAASAAEWLADQVDEGEHDPLRQFFHVLAVNAFDGFPMYTGKSSQWLREWAKYPPPARQVN